MPPPAHSDSRTPQSSEDPWVGHLGWVRRLALRLARDEAAADDLVQRTALVALRRREAVLAATAGGGVRGWLRRVLFHEARSGWRRDQNRRAREGDYALTAAPKNDGPEEALGHAEDSLKFTKRLIAAMEELDEPSRDVVVARYFHGQSIAEISASVGAPDRTVETRLRRARIKMRESLGRGDPGGDSFAGEGMGSWVSMILVTWGGRDLGGFVGAGAAVTKAGGQSGAAKAAGTISVAAKWGAGWLVGMIAMNMKVVLGCSVALLVGLVGALQWGEPEGTVPAPNVVGTAEPEAPNPESPDLAAVAQGKPRGGATDVPVPGAEPVEPVEVGVSFVTLIDALPPGTLGVWVVDEASNPVVGARVLVAEGLVFSGWAPPKVRDDAPRQVQSVGSDPGRPVLFEGLGKGPYFLQVTSPSGSKRSTSVDFDPKYGSTVIVRIGSARVFGRVTDGTGTGTPIAGAYLTLHSRRPIVGFTDEQKAIGTSISWAAKEASGLHVTTDENGEFSFEEVIAGDHSLNLDASVMDWDAGKQTLIPARYLEVDLAPGEQRRVDFPPGIESGGAVWRGHVVDAVGDPVVTSDFSFRHGKIRVASWDAERLDEPATFQGRGDANYDERIQYDIDGTFQLRLPAGRYDAWISSPHVGKMIHVIKAQDMLLAPGETRTQDLVLPGATLRGTVDDSLADLVETEAATSNRGKPAASLRARPSDSTNYGEIFKGPIDAKGAFVLYGMQPGDWILSAFGARARIELTIPAGATDAVTVLLPK